MLSSGNRVRVLVLEDVQDHAPGCATMLNERGVFAVSAETSAGLVDRFNFIPPPDLVLTDLVMPGVSGIEFIERALAHRQWCSVPVILMSVSPTEDQLSAVKRLTIPPDGFLVKPIDPEPLVRLVSLVLEGSEPTLMHRRLRRRSLQLRLELEFELSSIERSLSGTAQGMEAVDRELVAARRKLQTVQRSIALFRGESAGAREQARAQITAIQTEIHDLREQRDAFSAERRQLLLRRHTVTLEREREALEIQNRLQALRSDFRRRSAA